MSPPRRSASEALAPPPATVGEAVGIARGPQGAPARLVVVLTCHDRRATTLACLAALEVAARQAGLGGAGQLRGVLVDDGSRDGSGAAAAAAHPWLQVLQGDGQLYWNRGMHRGLALAMQWPADWLLWLNDDTLLAPDALQRLLQEHAALAAQHPPGVLLAGATCGPDGRLSYGGGRPVSRWRRFQYRPVWDARQPQRCTVVNGNCVLLPMALARRLGNLDPAYEHAMGDTDYALRAGQAGCAVYVASGHVGRCGNNPEAGSYTDRRLGLRARWAAMQQRKGLPWRSWLHFTRQHGGLLWPAYFAWPYLRLLLSALRGRHPRG